MANFAVGRGEQWWLRWYLIIHFLFHLIMTAMDSDDMMTTMDDDEDIRTNSNDDDNDETNDDERRQRQ